MTRPVVEVEVSLDKPVKENWMKDFPEGVSYYGFLKDSADPSRNGIVLCRKYDENNFSYVNITGIPVQIGVQCIRSHITSYNARCISPFEGTIEIKSSYK